MDSLCICFLLAYFSIITSALALAMLRRFIQQIFQASTLCRHCDRAWDPTINVYNSVQNFHFENEKNWSHGKLSELLKAKWHNFNPSILIPNPMCFPVPDCKIKVGYMLTIWSFTLWVNGFQNDYTYKL